MPTTRDYDAKRRAERPKLASLSPLVEQRLAPLVAQQPTDEAKRSRFRASTQHWHRWYKTRRWARIRWAQLTTDLFCCRMCKRAEADTSKLVCDHVEPHRGDPQRFWTGPFQTLCESCHSKVKQAEEEAARRGQPR